MARKFCKAYPGLECVYSNCEVLTYTHCGIVNKLCLGYILEEGDDVKKHPHEEMVRQIREVGESLIKNAESIAGYEKYLNGLKITVHFDWDESPVINVSRGFTPERFIERVDNNG